MTVLRKTRRRGIGCAPSGGKTGYRRNNCCSWIFEAPDVALAYSSEGEEFGDIMGYLRRR
jgi:hypothetical protein